MRTIFLLLLLASPGPPDPPIRGDGGARAVDTSRAPHWHRPELPSSTITAPKRIVSLAPVVTETLFLLGAGERVVGVTRFCDRPKEAQTRAIVGGYSDASLEQILAQRPDLVVAMPNLGQRALLDRVREQGVPVYVAFTDTLDETHAMIRALGVVVGAPQQAQALVERDLKIIAEMKLRASVGEKRVSHRVVVVVGQDPLVVAGPGTFADTALRLIGEQPATKQTDPQWPQWSLESLLARKVDVVVAAEGAAAAEALRKQFSSLGAKAPRVVSAEGPILMRPGPSFIDDVRTLETLVK